MNVRASNWARKDQTIVLGGLLLLGVLLFMLDLVGILQPLRNFGDYITNPVLYWTRQGTIGVNQLTQSVTAWATLKDENIALRKEVIELRSKDVQLESTKNENNALRQQLKIPVAKSVRYILARPLSYDVGDQVGTIKINQGKAAGVQEKQLVIFGNYLVGVIDTTNQQSSLVKTLFASNMELKGKLANNRTKGIVKNESNTLMFTQVLATNPLAVNDNVLLWEEGYPLEILIGQVTEVIRQKASPYQQGKLKPLLDYTDVDYLFVVTHD